MVSMLLRKNRISHIAKVRENIFNTEEFPNFLPKHNQISELPDPYLKKRMTNLRKRVTHRFILLRRRFPQTENCTDLHRIRPAPAVPHDLPVR